MSEDKVTEVTKGKKLGRWGLTATILYLIAIFGGLPLLASLGVVELHVLKLNEIGDFLAGAFGPLAIFWLVLGFFQQGEELRNSVETLKLQAEELANSVDQQRELVSVTRESFLHEREVLDIQITEKKNAMRPQFVISFQVSSRSSIGQYAYSFSMTNAGAPVSNFSATLEEEEDAIYTFSRPYLEKGQELSKKHIRSKNKHNTIKGVKITVSYTISNGEEHVDTYQATANPELENLLDPFEIQRLS